MFISASYKQDEEKSRTAILERMSLEDRDGARSLLSDVGRHLKDACAGSISEVFDADAPFVPRGCISQTWSFTEVLRSWMNTEEQEHDQASSPFPCSRMRRFLATNQT